MVDRFHMDRDQGGVRSGPVHFVDVVFAHDQCALIPNAVLAAVHDNDFGFVRVDLVLDACVPDRIAGQIQRLLVGMLEHDAAYVAHLLEESFASAVFALRFDQGDSVEPRLRRQHFHVEESVRPDKVRIALVLNEHFESFGNSFFGDFVVMVQMQMRQDDGVDAVENLFDRHRQLDGRIAQLFAVTQSKRFVAALFGEHRIDQKGLACILKDNGSVSDLLNVHDCKFSYRVCFFVRFSVYTRQRVRINGLNKAFGPIYFVFERRLFVDQTDKRIIEELGLNSRITMKELGERVHLTGPAAATRVEKLEDQGIIEGYGVQVNHAKMGCYTYAFLNIYIKETSHQPYLEFTREKKGYVLNNYKISGDGCYLLESRFPSNEALNEFLVELNEYANYKLSIVLDKA